MANRNRPCPPCEAAARNRAHVPRAIIDAHALEHRAMRRAGVGAQIWSIGQTPEQERRRQTYGLIGGVAIVGLWGLAFWWLVR